MTRTKTSQHKDGMIDNEFNNIYKEINTFNCPYASLNLDKDVTSGITAQIIATADYTALTGLLTGEICPSNELSSDTNGITANIYADGYFYAALSLSFATVLASTVKCAVYKNGSVLSPLSFEQAITVAASIHSASISTVVPINQGDVLQVRVKGDTTTSMLINRLNFTVIRLVGK